MMKVLVHRLLFWHVKHKICMCMLSYLTTTHAYISIVIVNNYGKKNVIPFTHLPLDKMAAILAGDIFKCIFLNGKVNILICTAVRS